MKFVNDMYSKCILKEMYGMFVFNIKLPQLEYVLETILGDLSLEPSFYKSTNTAVTYGTRYAK